VLSEADYATEGYWLVKCRDFSANTVNDYTLTFKRLTDISSEDIPA
jgi:hypothetical protein